MSELITRTGTMYRKFDETEYGDWKSRRFVLLDNSSPEWPDYIQFEQSNRKDAEYDNVDKLKYIADGTDIEVVFRVKGRKYEKDGEERFFNKMEVYKVTKVEQSSGTVDDNDVPDECPI